MIHTRPVMAALLLAGTVFAQSTYDEVVRSNEPWVVFASATSTATGLPYNYDAVNPPEYSAGTLGSPVGVPANTWSWRIIPGSANFRAGVRRVAGFRHSQVMSGETQPANYGGAYEAETVLAGVVARPSAPAGARNPDWSKVLVRIPALAAAGAPSQLYRVTRTLASPIAVSSSPGASGTIDLALAVKFNGGESKWIDGAQGFAATWWDGPTPWNTSGFYYPGTNTTTFNTDPRFVLYLNYLEAEPAIALHSDWGHWQSTGAGGLPGPILGHSIGTYFGNLASTAGNLGVSVRAGNYPNGIALVLLNFGPYFAGSFQFFGQTLELNPTDPVLTLLLGLPGIGLLPLDGAGNTDGAKIPIPQNAAWLGTTLGFEAFIADRTGQVRASTGSAFVRN